ncbi:MAG: Flp pilus assembly complex ATPase component TadA, partial [Selenomonadaceae bacterium]|nr:Flp pilus assembly complex ATPase component TadA [Selenomonadaceae bacterium]
MELKEKYFHLMKRARQNASNGLIEMVREQPARLQDERTPLADLMEFIIKTAVAERASDVHFEPLEQEVRIRLRINGYMKQFFQDMPWELYGNLLSRLKIMCGLD